MFKWHLFLHFPVIETNIESKSNIYLTSISFGAPTAGNNLFADYSNKVLGNNFIRVVNTMDIANYAWSNLLSVKSLYKYLRY